MIYINFIINSIRLVIVQILVKYLKILNYEKCKWEILKLGEILEYCNNVKF